MGKGKGECGEKNDQLKNRFESCRRWELDYKDAVVRMRPMCSESNRVIENPQDLLNISSSKNCLRRFGHTDVNQFVVEFWSTDEDSPTIFPATMLCRTLKRLIQLAEQLKSRIPKRAAKTFAFSCSIGPLTGIPLFLMILNHWINAWSTFSYRDFRSLFGFKTFELNDCLMRFLFLKIIEIVEPTPNSFARDEFGSPFSNLHIIASQWRITHMAKEKKTMSWLGRPD